MPKTFPLIPKKAYALLLKGTPAFLVTVGEDGWGHAVMTWAAAVSPSRVRFGVDYGSATLQNLRRTGRASLQVTGPGNILVLIKGKSHKTYDRLAAAPFRMEIWDLKVDAVRDQTWAGVIVTPVKYRWVGPKAEELGRIEVAVLEELRTRGRRRPNRQR